MSEITNVREAKKAIKAQFPRVSTRFGADKDTMPHMTSAAQNAVTELTDLFEQMTDDEIIGAAKILVLMNGYKSSAGYKRMFGLTFPAFAANLIVGSPAE